MSVSLPLISQSDFNKAHPHLCYAQMSLQQSYRTIETTNRYRFKIAACEHQREG